MREPRKSMCVMSKHGLAASSGIDRTHCRSGETLRPRRLRVSNPDDDFLAQHVSRARDGVQRNRDVSGVQKAIKLRPTGVKLSGHGLLGLLTFPHGSLQLPRKHPFYRNRLHFVPDTFLIQEAREAGTAVI